MINALQFTRVQLRVFIMITLMCIIPNINHADAATTTSITGGRTTHVHYYLVMYGVGVRTTLANLVMVQQQIVMELHEFACIQVPFLTKSALLILTLIPRVHFGTELYIVGVDSTHHIDQTLPKQLL